MIKSKEKLEKTTMKHKKANSALNTAVQQHVTAIKSEKVVKAKQKQEKSDKINAKNKWVKDMVQYAETEKAQKKVGVTKSKANEKKAKQIALKKAAAAKVELKRKKQADKVNREKSRKAAKMKIKKLIEAGTKKGIKALEKKNKGIEKTKKVREKAEAKLKEAKYKAKLAAIHKEVLAKKVVQRNKCERGQKRFKAGKSAVKKALENEGKFNAKLIAAKEAHGKAALKSEKGHKEKNTKIKGAKTQAELKVNQAKTQAAKKAAQDNLAQVKTSATKLKLLNVQGEKADKMKAKEITHKTNKQVEKMKKDKASNLGVKKRALDYG